jgi:phosphinothricin acetyltransferase
MSDLIIRRIEEGDVPALLAIYNRYIAETVVTFDLEPKTLDERLKWYRGFAPRGRHQCFVAVRDGAAVGWASTGTFRQKAAYDTTVETSIYLAPEVQGQGLGRRLYGTLLEALAGQDVHVALGCITVPNEASEGLHRAMGFDYLGKFREVGRKFGRYWDVSWYAKGF